MAERYFDESKYDGSQPYGGVALADISEAEWAALPKHVQESTDALPYFRKTKPSKTQAKTEPSQSEPSGGGSQ